MSVAASLRRATSAITALGWWIYMAGHAVATVHDLEDFRGGDYTMGFVV